MKTSLLKLLCVVPVILVLYQNCGQGMDALVANDLIENGNAGASFESVGEGDLPEGMDLTPVDPETLDRENIGNRQPLGDQAPTHLSVSSLGSSSHAVFFDQPLIDKSTYYYYDKANKSPTIYMEHFNRRTGEASVKLYPAGSNWTLSGVRRMSPHGYYALTFRKNNPSDPYPYNNIVWYVHKTRVYGSSRF